MYTSPSFFLAGTMQGSRSGIRVRDQGYRDDLRRAISEFYPSSRIVCPLEILIQRFGARLSHLTAHYETTTRLGIVERVRYDAAMTELFTAFTDMVKLASTVDVIVSYVPGHEPSMGTAMEIWSAYTARKIVVTISEMTQNLALVSTSTIIVPTVAEFETLLRQGWLDEALLVHGLVGT